MRDLLGMHAQLLQIPDNSADESDPADNVDDADTENATTSTAGSVIASSDTSDCCEVWLLLPRDGVALVPCGHSRFCGSCADTVASVDRGRPICGTGATENARPENAGLENDGQNFRQLWAKLRGLENAGLENDGPC